MKGKTNKAVFVNLPAYGHLNATLGLVSKFVEEECEVYCTNTVEFRDLIEGTGANFIGYEGLEESDFSISPSATFPDIAMPTFKILPDVYPTLLERVRMVGPDVIFYDPLSFLGYHIAKELGVPAIATQTVLEFNRGMISTRDILEFSGLLSLRTGMKILPTLFYYLRFLYKVRLPYRGSWNVIKTDPIMKIHFMPPIFQPDSDQLPSNHIFAKPFFSNRKRSGDFPVEQFKSFEGHKILISTSSVGRNDINLLERLIEPFAGRSDYIVAMSIGRQVDKSELRDIPSNVLLGNFIPQAELVHYADLLISHGGVNSIMEGLVTDTPILCLPTITERRGNANRLVELGLGRIVDPYTFTSSEILSAVEVMLSCDYSEAFEKFHISLDSALDLDELFLKIEHDIQQFRSRNHF